MQFNRHTRQSRDKLMNCCPTEAFLVGTEASQALDTNIGHIKWDGRTAKAWQLPTDKHPQMALIPPAQTFDHSPPSHFKKLWLLIPPTIACPSVTNSDASYFSPFGVCVCVWRTGAWEWIFRYVRVHAHVRAPAQMCTCAESQVFCLFALHLIHWVGVSPVNPELCNMASLS